MTDKLEINSEFQEAFDLIDKTDDCVFVTGNAGTGKTTFLRFYMTRAKKKTVVLAPTGVAALNCGGETIHSFFHFGPDITEGKVKKKKDSYKSSESIYKKVETIIIDEASMLRCDLLDCVDRFLRLNRGNPHEPFGGVQMVFIGDLKQLPPVVENAEKHIFSSLYKTPYFLSANSLNECMLHTVEFKKMYRQYEVDFITLLNAVRNNTVTNAQLEELNRKFSPYVTLKPMSVYLTTTNRKASDVNNQYLAGIDAERFVFTAESKNIDEKKCGRFPAERILAVKKGAQIMMVNNERGRWANGTIGIVDDIQSGVHSPLIFVKFPNGRTESVRQFKWELFRYKLNEARDQIETESIGFFKQYPLRLSWAVTIHKSQGKTFDSVVIDMGNGAFAPGQLYVALSRCRSFSGIRLSRPITWKDI
ncbi:MAG: AAA family ATPase [Endomicrobium sp.]|jgi:ATP-dependent exoDNAse (exonuclease V) alpha subunit|nr:AAA family ATPase [Endomicrobium sp.]